MYYPQDAPKPWLETDAHFTPFWARLATLHLYFFPHARNGRVQKALGKCGRFGPKLFRLRFTGGLRWLVDRDSQPNYAVYRSPLAIEGAEAFFEHALMALVQRNDRVIDVGANRGYYSIYFRGLVGDGGRVIAVEPLSSVRRYLESNLRLNHCDDVMICPFGASNAEGDSDITMHPQALGSSSMHPGSGLMNLGNTVTTSISLRTLTAILDEVGEREPTIIKIDIEGHEFAALCGAETVIRRAHPLIIFEAWPELAATARWTLADLERLLGTCGPYRFSAILWKDGSLRHLPSPLAWDDFASVASDLVAWVPDRHQERIDRLACDPLRAQS